VDLAPLVDPEVFSGGALAQFSGNKGQKQAKLLKDGALHVVNGRIGGFEKERKTTM